MTEIAAEENTWAPALLALRQEMGAWIEESIRRQRNLPWQGGHDEGTFASSWAAHYLLTGNQAILHFLSWLRDGFRRWAQDHYFHGYPQEAEIHHGPENFIIYFPCLLSLDEHDAAAREIVEHAAHHVGNWADDVPDWYDWSQHRFRSYRLGTRQVEAHPPHDFEVPDHFRMIQLALAGYLATGQDKYLDLCRGYADRWCQLLSQGSIPLAVLPERDQGKTDELYSAELIAQASRPPRAEAKGDPARPERPAHAERRGRRELAEGPSQSGDQTISALEPHVAAGTIDVFLDLHLITGEQRYAAAAKTLVTPLVDELSDPYSRPPGMLLSKYRVVTGDTTLDRQIKQMAATWEFDAGPGPLAMILADPEGFIYSGVGKRVDMIRWGEPSEGCYLETTCPPVSSLMLAYQVTGDRKFLTRALSEAAARLSLARRHLGDGREHGCGGRTISAVVRGHGRDSGAGEVTTTLYPAALGAIKFCGTDRLQVRYAHEDGSPGLPEEIAGLCEPSGKNERKVCLFNAGSEPISLQIIPQPPGCKIREVTVDDQPEKQFSPEAATVSVNPGQESRIVLQL